MLPRVKHCCLVKVASYITWCWHPRLKTLQRGLEEAARIPYIPSLLTSLLAMERGGEGGRRTENKY